MGFTAIISFITASLIVYALTTATAKNPLSHARLGLEECGLSPGEARKNKCIFDPIIMGWVPGRCHDADLARDFMSRRNWTFHRTPDANMNSKTDHVMGIHDLLAGDWDFLYVEPQFYIHQCLYTWKKTWRAAVDAAVVVDGYLADEHHTNHCQMLISQGPEREKNLYMKYASCSWGKHGSAGRFGWYRVIKGERVYRLDV
ncbi:hypothetical protein QBC37DRAFT_314795 [Rhypophila decipiens]|uniref:Uncharacterized protein n=1 Tax=Rhypophila decipiens TaxID=261697 RepID=A0AAN7BAQ5_9PEZI|nr:hypothetical protein QBC37DRAFT_314795 [Rhypophila decipiens]